MTTIPGIPDNLQNLPVLRAFLNALRSAVINDINNAGGGGGSGNDIFAADRIVSSDPTKGTDTTIQSAIDNLPAGGGTIFVKAETYTITDTISWGDINIELRFSEGATIVTTGLGAKPLFKQLNVVTAFRYPQITGGKFVGENSAGAQYFFEDADSTGKARPTFVGCDIRSFRRVFNISAGDATFTVGTELYCDRCYIEPPTAASKLGTTPSPHNSYAWGTSIHYVQCRLQKEDDGTLGWTDDFDGDHILVSSSIILNDGCKVDGLTTDNGCSLNINGTAEVFGGSYDSWDSIQGAIADFPGAGGILKVSSATAIINCVLSLRGSIVLNQTGVLCKIKQIPGNTPRVVAVDILAGADNCIVEGEFIDNTTASIRTAAQKTIIDGCIFSSTGTHKTVLETGAADFTLVTGCIGIGSGGGFSLPGINSLVGLDNIG